MPVTPAFQRLRPEDLKLKASLKDPIYKREKSKA